MKIAFIGNSHLAAVKLGWDNVGSEYPHLSPLFFGAPALRLDGLVADNKKLIPANSRLSKELELTSGGLNEIDFTVFNAVFLIGLNWSWMHFPSSTYSSALRNAWVLPNFEQSLCGRMYHKVAALTDRPIYIIHKPLNCARPNEDRTVGPPYSQRFHETERAMRDVKAKLLSQPSETIEDDRFTAHAYGIGGVGLGGFDGTHYRIKGVEDYTHMNGAFGKKLIAIFDKALKDDF